MTPIDNLKWLGGAPNLQSAVLAFERYWIEISLAKHNGKIKAAAKDLGISHQSLYWIIKTRQPGLYTPKKRLRSIMTKR